MSPKFYHSYHEFKENYDSDFDEFKSVFPNATELDYIDEISGKYIKWIGSNGKCKDSTVIKVEKGYGPRGFEATDPDDWMIEPDFVDYEIKYIDLAELINRILINLQRNLVISEIIKIDIDSSEVYEKDFRDFFNSTFININSSFEQWEIDTYLGKVIIPHHEHLFIYPFLKFSDVKLKDFEDDEFNTCFSRFGNDPVGFDVFKFRDFQFSIRRIIDQLIRREKYLMENNEDVLIERMGKSLQEIPQVKENDSQSADETDLHSKNFPIPLRIALLNELGLIKNLNMQPYVSDEARYKVIHAIVGGNYDNVKEYYRSLRNEKTSKIINQKNKDRAKDFINSKKL